MWDKFVSQVKAYPWLFGGVALAIVVWIFWPSGGASSNAGDMGAAMQANAIAQSAAANAQLMLAHEETQRVGLQVAAAQAINAQNTAASVQAKQIEASMYQFGTTASVDLAELQKEAAIALGIIQRDTTLGVANIQVDGQVRMTDFILASQNSAQKWVADMEAQSGIVPGNFQAYGFINSGPSIVKIEPSAVASQPVYTPPMLGNSVFGDGGWLDSLAGSDAYGQVI